MENIQSDKKVGVQVRIDAGWHNILAHMRADTHRSIRSLVEEALTIVYSDYQKGK